MPVNYATEAALASDLSSKAQIRSAMWAMIVSVSSLMTPQTETGNQLCILKYYSRVCYLEVSTT